MVTLLSKWDVWGLYGSVIISTPSLDIGSVERLPRIELYVGNVYELMAIVLQDYLQKNLPHPLKKTQIFYFESQKLLTIFEDCFYRNRIERQFALARGNRQCKPLV